MHCSVLYEYVSDGAHVHTYTCMYMYVQSVDTCTCTCIYMYVIRLFSRDAYFANFEIAAIRGINFHEINIKPHPRT